MRENSSRSNVIRKLLVLFLAIFYIAFVVSLSFGSLVAGVLALIPGNASKANYMGYYSVCSFAPFSTIILAVMSTIGFLLFLKMGHFLKTKYRSSNFIK